MGGPCGVAAVEVASLRGDACAVVEKVAVDGAGREEPGPTADALGRDAEHAAAAAAVGGRAGEWVGCAAKRGFEADLVGHRKGNVEEFVLHDGGGGKGGVVRMGARRSAQPMEDGRQNRLR